MPTSKVVDIDDKISFERNTAFSLMGAGFHWDGGL